MWLCPGLRRHARATGLHFGHKQGKINVLQRQTGFCPLGAISEHLFGAVAFSVHSSVQLQACFPCAEKGEVCNLIKIRG